MPELWAKPEIDILVTVRDIDTIAHFHRGMVTLGYVVRSDAPSPGSHHFTRNEGSRRTHKVHVCAPDHGSVKAYLLLRDQLRQHAEIRNAYQALKLELQRTNRTGIREYLDGKEPFIAKVVTAAHRQAAPS